MNLIPLRTAAIAGTAAIALSCVAVPAFAADGSHALTNSSSVSTMDAPDGTTPAPDETNAPEPENESSDVSDDNENEASDDSGAEDSTPAPTASTAPLPAEQGTPVEHVTGALEPSAFARKGVKVTFTGLTAGAEYQPFYSTSAMGDSIKHPRKASGEGTLTFVWKPSKARTFLGTYNVGIVGIDTDLHLSQAVEVKYDSDLAWKPATRHGRTVTLSVVADHTKASGKGDSAWKKVVVDFQKKVGSTWVTVKKDRTDAQGVASVTVASGRHSWRAVVASSAKVSGSKTRGHKK